MTAPLLASGLAGLALGLSLIIAIGAQNAFVLRQGIRRQHVVVVVVICTLSDAALIALGVGGAGALFAAAPWLMVVARWGGAAFLLVYGILAARRALRRPAPEASGLTAEEPSSALDADPGSDPGADLNPDLDDGATARTEFGQRAGTRTATRSSRRLRPGSVAGVALTTLALTWLNPHVYLDTVVLLGSIASTHGEHRWAFGAGAMVGSALWFTALGVAARALAPVFARPSAWRILDGIIAVVMIGLAVGLLVTT